MPKANKLSTAIAVVLDRSGSMESVKADTISGFNSWLADQKAGDGAGKVKFYLTLFDGTSVDHPYDGAKLSDVQPLTTATYVPRGATPLYDAIGATIADMETRKADRYLLVVITDGEENASTEYTHAAIKAKIEALEAAGNWTVVYLGSTLNAVDIARSIGVRGGNAAYYVAGTETATFRGVSNATRSYTASVNLAVEDFAIAIDGDTTAHVKTAKVRGISPA